MKLLAVLTVAAGLASALSPAASRVRRDGRGRGRGGDKEIEQPGAAPEVPDPEISQLPDAEVPGEEAPEKEGQDEAAGEGREEAPEEEGQEEAAEEGQEEAAEEGQEEAPEEEGQEEAAEEGQEKAPEEEAPEENGEEAGNEDKEKDNEALATTSYAAPEASQTVSPEETASQAPPEATGTPAIDPSTILNFGTGSLVTDILANPDPDAQLIGLATAVGEVMSQLGLAGLLTIDQLVSLGLFANMALFFRMHMLQNLLQLQAINNVKALQALQRGVVFGSQFDAVAALSAAKVGAIRGTGFFRRDGEEHTPDALVLREEMRKIARTLETIG